MVLRAYRYRFYPTDEQCTLLAKTFGCCRFVYNHFLKEKERHYKDLKKSLSYGDCAELLGDLKNEHLWLREVSSVALQQSLRHLEQAFLKFFKREAKFPKPKKRRYRQSACFMRNAFVFRDGELTLAKCKTPLKIRWSRRFEGEPTSITISKDCQEKYYISILVEEIIQPLPRVDRVVGIDLGLKATLTTSDGKKVAPLNALKKQLKRLKIKQQNLSRKTKGSANAKKGRITVAKVLGKVRDTRNDYLHKQSKQLVIENQVISAESLNVKNMLKNKRLARAIGDAGWGKLIQFIRYKSDWYGRQFVQVDPFFPSTKQCSSCKELNHGLTLNDRMWICPSCKKEHDRDITSAINIREEGLRILNTVGHTEIKACGVDVRPIRKTGRQSAVNQEFGLRRPRILCL